MIDTNVENISPIFPRMYASGTFINSFSPKQEKETQCIVNAIKAFKSNIIIVLDDTIQERNLKPLLQEDVNYWTENNPLVLLLSKSKACNSRDLADPYTLT